jgi:glucose dehydrogenase
VHLRKMTVLSVSVAGLLQPTWALMAQNRRTNDLALRNVGKPGEEWHTCGLTPGETRYSPLTEIDKSNVSRLGLAWSYEVGPGGGKQEATPLYWNGNIYSITNWSVVFSVDARTGKECWRWDPEVNQAAVRPKKPKLLVFVLDGKGTLPVTNN